MKKNVRIAVLIILVVLLFAGSFFIIKDKLGLSSNLFGNSESEAQFIPNPTEEAKEFCADFNRLCQSGLTTGQAMELLGYFSSDRLQIIEEAGFPPFIFEAITKPYFNSQLLQRYINYAAKNPNADTDKILVYVGCGLDNDYYTDAVTVKNPDSLDVIVNKYNKLEDDYSPTDLVKLTSYARNSEQYLRSEAADAFVKMAKAAKGDSIELLAGSCYRTIKKQKSIYDQYKKNMGLAKTEKMAARPGYSEHHTGLAVDIYANGAYIADNTKAFKWLSENCTKYGFFMRYPEDKQEITGYRYEPWHYRYIGEDIAAEITKNKWSYEEYIIYSAVYSNSVPDIAPIIDEIKEMNEHLTSEEVCGFYGISAETLDFIINY